MVGNGYSRFPIPVVLQTASDTYPNVQYDSSMTSCTVSQVTSNMKVDDNIDVARRTYTFSELLFCIEVQ